MALDPLKPRKSYRKIHPFDLNKYIGSDLMKTSKGGKMYICNLCNRTFLCKSHLDDHARLHTGEKPFACEICGKLFAQKSNMKSHMYVHRNIP